MAVQTTQNNKVAELDVFSHSRSLGAEAWLRLLRNKAAVTGLIIISLFTFMAVRIAW